MWTVWGETRRAWAHSSRKVETDWWKSSSGDCDGLIT